MVVVVVNKTKQKRVKTFRHTSMFNQQQFSVQFNKHTEYTPRFTEGLIYPSGILLLFSFLHTVNNHFSFFFSLLKCQNWRETRKPFFFPCLYSFCLTVIRSRRRKMMKFSKIIIINPAKKESIVVRIFRSFGLFGWMSD